MGLRAALFAIFLAVSTPALAQDRVALVIGNDRYANLPADRQLNKAVNDARAVGGALEKLGFKVIRGENLNRAQMVDHVFSFTQAIKPGDTAIVFFAGHGVSFSGGNYLLPTDIPLPKQGEETRARNLSLGEADIVADIQERKPRVVVMMLDACRDNPFRQPGLTRSIGNESGLARGREAEGVFSIYSAGFGQTALDSLGTGDRSPNSIFTRALVPALSRTDVHLADLVIDMREEVARLAATVGHQQYPAYYDQTRGGRVYLAGRPAPAPVAPSPPAAPPVVSPPVAAAPPATVVPPQTPPQPPAAQKPPVIAALPSATSQSAVALREVWSRRMESGLFTATMSRDGRMLAVARFDVDLVDADNGKLLRSIAAHKGAVNAVTFSPDGKLLASASDARDLKLWDASTGALIRTFESRSDPYNSIAFSPDGLRLAAGSGKSISIWEVSGRLIRTFTADDIAVRAFAFSPDGKFIAAGGAYFSLWDANSGKLVRKFPGRPGLVHSIVYSSDGRRLATGGSNPNGSVEIWDPNVGASVRLLSDLKSEVETVAISPDGRHVLSGGIDKLVRIWNSETGQLLATIDGNTEKVRSITYSADGRRVMWGDWAGPVRVFASQ